MNKKELVAAIAERLEITKVLAEKLENARQDIIVETLQNGESVKITGFENYEVKDVAARDYRNPQTGETVSKPAKKVVKIKASKVLSELV